MQSRDFNELAGRIEGLGRAVMHLVAEMERIGALDGPAFADQLRGAVVVLGPKLHPGDGGGESDPEGSGERSGRGPTVAGLPAPDH